MTKKNVIAFFKRDIMTPVHKYDKNRDLVVTDRVFLRYFNNDRNARKEHSRGRVGLLILPARVAGIHGDKDTEAGLDDDVASFEYDALVVSLQRLLDCHDLLAHHREHLVF